METIGAKSVQAEWLGLLVAWIIAALASLSALFIGEVMGQAPCSLCWYQRAFMFPLAIMLMVASFVADGGGVWRYALPVAAVGWVVALYHNLLYFELIERAIVPCGQGPSCSGAEMTLFGAISIPLLSLGAFTAIILLMLFVKRGQTK